MYGPRGVGVITYRFAICSFLRLMTLRHDQCHGTTALVNFADNCRIRLPCRTRQGIFPSGCCPTWKRRWAGVWCRILGDGMVVDELLVV